jgi:hypothetical protein
MRLTRRRRMHNDDPTLHHERPALYDMHGTWSSFYSVFLVSMHDALRQSVPSILMNNAISARSNTSGSAGWGYQWCSKVIVSCYLRPARGWVWQHIKSKMRPDESGVNIDVITNMANEDRHALRTCVEMPGSSGQRLNWALALSSYRLSRRRQTGSSQGTWFA